MLQVSCHNEKPRWKLSGERTAPSTKRSVLRSLSVSHWGSYHGATVGEIVQLYRCYRSGMIWNDLDYDKLIPLGISSTKWRGLTPRNGTKMI